MSEQSDEDETSANASEVDPCNRNDKLQLDHRFTGSRQALESRPSLARISGRPDTRSSTTFRVLDIPPNSLHKLSLHSVLLLSFRLSIPTRKNVFWRANSNHPCTKRRFATKYSYHASRLDTDLFEGTDQSQGKGQVVSNINACLAVQSTIRGTLGPYGGDLLLVDENGKQTITNDGATVMKVVRKYKL